MTHRFPSLLLAPLLLAGAAGRAEPAPSADSPPRVSALQVLEAYENTLSQRRVWAMEVSSTMLVEWVRVDPWSEGLRGSRWRARYYRDGDRRDVESAELARFDAAADPVPDPNVGRGSRAILDGGFVYYETDAAGAVTRPAAGRGGHRAFARTLSVLGRAQALDGYAGDPKGIVELARAAADLRVIGGREAVDGRPCVVLGWRCEYGAYTVWFDPASGYHPRRVVVEKGVEDFYGDRDRRILRWFGYTPPGSPRPVSLKSVRYEMGGVRFAPAGGTDFPGTDFPVACLVTEVRRYSDGNVQRIFTECVRSKLDFTPDFQAAAAFVPRLREGAALSNLDDRKTPLLWRGGRPVPRPESKSARGAERE